jgi:tetratricopeptide (TPR) repeat protein
MSFLFAMYVSILLLLDVADIQASLYEIFENKVADLERAFQSVMNRLNQMNATVSHECVPTFCFLFLFVYVHYAFSYLTLTHSFQRHFGTVNSCGFTRQLRPKDSFEIQTTIECISISLFYCVVLILCLTSNDLYIHNSKKMNQLQYQIAFQCLEFAARIRPNNLDILLEWAKLASLSSFDVAQRLFEQALELAPTQTKPYITFAKYILKSQQSLVEGTLTQAQNYLQKVLELGMKLHSNSIFFLIESKMNE